MNKKKQPVHDRHVDESWCAMKGELNRKIIYITHDFLTYFSQSDKWDDAASTTH